MEKIIGTGAEAIIVRNNSSVIKKRVKKSYRIKILDERIRKLRTRNEAKLLAKASESINVPKIKNADEKKNIIEMGFISGKKLSEHLDKLKDYKKISKKIGESISKIHDSGIIHGDLTTSNMILKNDEVFIIDFGLGFRSNKVEDKAVDLHLIKQALEAKHPKIFNKSFEFILKGYEASSEFDKVLKRLEKVEKRGRYKSKV